MANENVVEKSLTDLLDTTIKALRDRISSSEASASDIKNAIELLKNNSITFEAKTKADSIPDAILAELPFNESNVYAIKRPD